MTSRIGGRDGKVAQGRFHIKQRLGGGSFGEIYKGIDTWKSREVAIKFELCKAPHAQLCYESKVYRVLHHSTHEVVGIPECLWFGVEGDYNVMVLELCGPCLEDLYNYCGRAFSLKTVCMIGEQVMHRLEYIHNKHFIHRDIKPENFCMGIGDRGHHVYAIDFGLSKKYYDPRRQQHIPFKEGKPLTGTARYCSVNTHLGFEQSRRDDIESVGFLLLYIHLGVLPWQGIRMVDAAAKTVRIGEKKSSIPLEMLCREAHPLFLRYMRHARSLKFEERPDYDMLRNLFRDAMEREGYTKDYVFDWIRKRAEERVSPSSSGPTQGTPTGGAPANGMTPPQPQLKNAIAQNDFTGSTNGALLGSESSHSNMSTIASQMSSMR
eukprot:PhM_4_TR7789/c0_g1_i1/m.50073/K02218/CSNK1, CKI; casein kinase 1